MDRLQSLLQATTNHVHFPPGPHQSQALVALKGRGGEGRVPGLIRFGSDVCRRRDGGKENLSMVNVFIVGLSPVRACLCGLWDAPQDEVDPWPLIVTVIQLTSLACLPPFPLLSLPHSSPSSRVVALSSHPSLPPNSSRPFPPFLSLSLPTTSSYSLPFVSQGSGRGSSWPCHAPFHYCIR